MIEEEDPQPLHFSHLASYNSNSMGESKEIATAEPIRPPRDRKVFRS